MKNWGRAETLTHIHEATPLHKAPEAVHALFNIFWKCGFYPAFVLQKPQEKYILHFNCRKQLNANSLTASKVTSGFQESRKERVTLIFQNKDEFNLLY